MAPSDEGHANRAGTRESAGTETRPISRREGLRLAAAVAALAPGLGVTVGRLWGQEIRTGKLRLAWYATDGREFKEVASQELPERVARLIQSARGPGLLVEWFVLEDGERRRIHSQDLPSVMMKIE